MGGEDARAVATMAVTANTVHCRRFIGIADDATLDLRLRRSRVRWRCGSVGIGYVRYSVSQK